MRNYKKKKLNGWKLVDLSKEERNGKTIEELDELRKKKYVEQLQKRKEMAMIASENNMTTLFKNAQKEKKKREAIK
jgi:hypothetical protein